MSDFKEQTCILLPALNEAETIGTVIDGFKQQGYNSILVIDGNSHDKTWEIARNHGASVVRQTGTGKGQAVQQARDYIDATYILMADADMTYLPEEADSMLHPIVNGTASHSIGNRFAQMQPGAMNTLNKLGNTAINTAFKFVHKQDYKDILSGYQAFTKDAFERLYLKQTGFGIETEIAVQCVKNNITTKVVPITYKPRPEGSETNLSPISHGSQIIFTLYQLAKTNNPLFYFGSLGTISSSVGAVLATFIGYDWVVNGTSHDVLAIVSAATLLIGVQLLVFGLLSDMLLDYHKEQLREIRRH